MCGVGDMDIHSTISPDWVRSGNYLTHHFLVKQTKTHYYRNSTHLQTQCNVVAVCVYFACTNHLSRSHRKLIFDARTQFLLYSKCMLVLPAMLLALIPHQSLVFDVVEIFAPHSAPIPTWCRISIRHLPHALPAPLWNRMAVEGAVE